MTETKKFPLRVVLTITTGRLLTKPKGPKDNGIGDLYEFLDWMSSGSTFTHQLGRVGKNCAPFLLQAFPELVRADTEKLDGLMDAAGTEEGIEVWLADCINLGMKAEYDIPKLPEGTSERRDPLEELIERRGSADDIVVVSTD